MAIRRGQISIDRIVAIRSTALPFYVIIRRDGTLTASDEVSEDGNDFLTTRTYGEQPNLQISFNSIHGHYLSAEGDRISTKSYCSADEKFDVVKCDTQYAFRTRSGKFLSLIDREPYVTVAAAQGETEVFQLFSLMMMGVNVGKQLELVEKSGEVMIDGLLGDDWISELNTGLNMGSGENEAAASGHEVRTPGLLERGQPFAALATHPLVLQIVRRAVTATCRLSGIESCRTDADYVRKELEETSWNVIHPYSAVEYPGMVDEKISFTATWFLDEFDSTNSTWAWLRPPAQDGTHSPQLPHLSSAEEVANIVQAAKPLHAKRGAVWLYLGPVWLSNNVGAASFWKDYDAQTRYLHASGKKPQGNFRALADSANSGPRKDELCPTLIQATYVREYVKARDPAPACLPDLGEATADLQRLLA